MLLSLTVLNRNHCAWSKKSCINGRSSSASIFHPSYLNSNSCLAITCRRPASRHVRAALSYCSMNFSLQPIDFSAKVKAIWIQMLGARSSLSCKAASKLDKVRWHESKTSSISITRNQNPSCSAASIPPTRNKSNELHIYLSSLTVSACTVISLLTPSNRLFRSSGLKLSHLIISSFNWRALVRIVRTVLDISSSICRYKTYKISWHISWYIFIREMRASIRGVRLIEPKPSESHILCTRQSLYIWLFSCVC